MAVVVIAWAGAAAASPPDKTADESEGQGPESTAQGFNLFDGLDHRTALLGNIGGLRTYLGEEGITIGLTETSEILGNTSGGVKRSWDYDGLTTLTLQMDTQKAFDWKGGLLNVSGLDVHGSNLSADNLATLQTASGIEADNGIRLWEAWYQQSFLDGSADIKIGQQSLDQEFIVSQQALLFVNTMFGWPMLPSADLPSGGPAYPLSSPGIRLRAQPTGSLSLLGGVFDDNPSGIGPASDDDSQRLDRYGTNFRWNDEPLVIAEIQYSRPGIGEMSYAGEEDVLPGTYKLGFWYDFGRFADQKLDSNGLSLGNVLSDGNPAVHHGDYSIYGVVDQLIWRPNAQSPRSVNFFMRAMGAPEEDRNLIDFSLNAGFTLKDPFLGHDNDTLGIGFGMANVSSSASSFDKSFALASGTGYPVRTNEKFIEVTYQYQLAPWIQIQPDFQYVFNPGAGLSNPNDASNNQRIHDEAVFGLRTNIIF